MTRSTACAVIFALALCAGSPMAARGDDWCPTNELWAARNPQPEGGGCPLQGVCDAPDVRDDWIPGAETPLLTLRMRFVVFAEDDGSNPTATQVEVDAQLEHLNADLAPSRIQIAATTDFVNDSTYRFYSIDEDFEMKQTYAVDPEFQVNVYVVQTSGFSFGTFPWDPNALTFLGGIVMHQGHFGPTSSVLTHELGHNVGLWHTHHGVSEVPPCSACYERADGVDGDTTGDYASDTPPTPVNFSCAPPGGNDPCSDTPWGETDFFNFMSYTSDNCREHFTPHQRGRLQCWIDDVLSGWVCDACAGAGACCEEGEPGVFTCTDVALPDCQGTFFGAGTRCDDVGPETDRCDCNGNGTVDTEDIETGDSEDCNDNVVPDECEPNDDCNENDVPDICDIADGTESDCNGNSVPDRCDIDDGTSDDCDENDVPDDCQADCNLNGVADVCDIADGTSSDDDENGVPDECQRTIYVAAEADGAETGEDWSDAYRDLQAALADARLGDRIHVARGVYRPSDVPLRTATFLLADGVKLLGGFAGPGDANPGERRPETHLTVLSGDLADNDGPDFSNYLENCYNVVSSVGNDETTALDGFVISGGNGNGFGLPYDAGGGLRIEGGNPTIANCTFELNSAVFGGGVELFAGADATFVDCTFRENRATFRGGGLHCNGSAPLLVGCDFIGNDAENSGGGMRSTQSAPTLARCRFIGNTAEFGGGIVNDESDPVLSDCLLAGNAAVETSGGMHNWRADPILDNCTFGYNSAGIVGGGIYSLADSQVTLTGCVLWGNRDQDGTEATSQIATDGSALDPIVNYSCVQGGWSTGDGNIADEPIFMDANGPDNESGNGDDDYRLYRASPCVDAGDPDANPGFGDLDGHARVLCGRIDIGSYEFGIGDLGCDGYVDLDDFAEWPACETGPGGGPYEVGCEAFDFDADGDVDWADFGAFQDGFVGDCPIQITQQPQATTACEGEPAELTIEAVGPDGEALTYQWRRDGLDLVGAEGPTLDIPQTVPSDGGSHRCVVTATCRQIEISTAADLVVTDPRTEFLTHPVGGEFCVGASVFMFVNASSFPSYQWFKDGEPIEGATSTFWVISDAQVEDSGAYHVEATNGCNTAESDVAIVEIIPCGRP